MVAASSSRRSEVEILGMGREKKGGMDWEEEEPRRPASVASYPKDTLLYLTSNSSIAQVRF